MIQLNRLGHVLLQVADVERSKAFYSDLLGFEVVEQDPVHGGVFMTLGEHGHTIDLSPVDDPETAQPLVPNRLGVHHFAFQVESFEALKDAYFTLQDHGVEVVLLPSHQLVGSGSVEEQLEYFYAQYARRVAPLYGRQA